MKIVEVDSMSFRTEEIIEQFFDIGLDMNRDVWNDTQLNKFKFVNAIMRDEKIILFSENNGYKIKFDNNGKFDEKSIDLIPEINWRHFYVSDMKHVYLFSSANDLKTNRSGLSYYDIEKLFMDRELSKYFIVKTTELEIA